MSSWTHLYYPGGWPCGVANLSPAGTAVEVDDAVGETAFVQQIDLQTVVVGDGLYAASHHDGA